MKKTMKPPFVILATLLLISIKSLNAQQDISFTYDAAGNRIQRSIILKSTPVDSTELANLQNPDAIDKYTDNLNGQEIILYPNPTKGTVRVELKNYSTEREIELIVHDIQGKEIFHQSHVGLVTELNLNNKPAGNYILIIKEGDKVIQWKIVKE